MFNSHYALMKEFASRLSVSGREHDFSNDLKAWMKPFADTVSTDAMGNLLLVKKTAVLDAPRLLLTAHMDQVGFMVTHIENNGYIRLSPVGSVNPIAYSNIPVKFSRGSKGILVAETNCKPEEMKPNKLYADIGTISLKETEKYVQVGDVCAIDVPLMKLKGSRIAGAALDNKASCAIIYKIAQLLSAEEALPFEVGFAFTVQEEVGCRGSKTIAYSFAPSYALNFDVTPCYDTIGSIPGNVRLGKGAAI
ncbi:MAG TPA: hypothetical protein DER23_04755, partial [Clostridiales bacterium]|nr:hypothetical protein [Clostridiales bacterium]